MSPELTVADERAAALARARAQFVPIPIGDEPEPDESLSAAEVSALVATAVETRNMLDAAHEFTVAAWEDPTLLEKYAGAGLVDMPEIVAEIRGRKRLAELHRQAERTVEASISEMYGLDVQLRLVAAGAGCVWRPVRTVRRSRGRRARVARRARAPSSRRSDDPEPALTRRLSVRRAA